MKPILAAVFVMLGLPWLAVTFAPSDAGMAICFLLFFTVNPIFSLFCGIHSANQLRQRWFQPFLTNLLFLLGVRLIFDSTDISFLVYAGIYLVLGLGAMGVTALLHRSRK